MKKDLSFTVDAKSALLPFLLEQLRGKSRNHIKGILKRGQVEIDGKICTDYAYTLRPGQTVRILALANTPDSVTDIKVLYEDSWLIAIDKPAGLLTIAADNGQENTAYRKVNSYLRRSAPNERVFIVHRLDRETSGVLLLAKNESVKHTLQDNWDKLVTKRAYLALVEGRPPKQEGQVRSWLKQTKTLLMYSGKYSEDAKLAVTNYRILKASDKYALLEVLLETGRKNQIRVHMKDLGCPVAGDKKYKALTNPLGRLGLHAAELSFTHPTSGKPLSINAEIPPAFIEALR